MRALLLAAALALLAAPLAAQTETPDHRAAYVQGANHATATYLVRADSALAAGDTAAAGANVRQALGRVRALDTNIAVLRALVADLPGVPVIPAQVDTAQPAPAAVDTVTWPSPEVAFILGPQLKAGSPANPWPWFDQNELARAKVHAAAFPAVFDSTAFGDAVMNQQYYDLGLTLYLAAYRSGDPALLADARRVTDVWMRGLDWRQRKWGGTSPRNSSLGGVILRALDGHPEYWPSITNYTRTMFQMWVGARVAYPELYYGVRDGGYMLLYAAWLAKVHPDPAVREEFRQKALTAGRDYYARLQKPNGAWYWKDGAVASLGLEEEPFMVGLLLDAMIATHRLTGDTAVARAIVRSADHMWSIYRKDAIVPEPRGLGAAWRCVPYFDFPDGSVKQEEHLAGEVRDSAGTVTKLGWDTNTIRECRQRNSLIVQAFGYAYHLTGDAKYRQEGDEMFAATYGHGQGPGADPWYGLGDFREKEFNQAYRSAGRYLAWRLLTPAN